MRILHLDTGRSMGGGQWQVLRLIEGLDDESTLLARAGSPLFEAARQRGFRVQPVGVIRELLMARHHDLVHAHDARGHTIAALARGAPLVVSRRVAFSIGSRWKYARGRHYIAVSQYVKSILCAHGIPEEKISVVYDGVPPSLARSQQAPSSVIAPARKAMPLPGIDLKLSTDLERDLRDAAAFVYITRCEGLGSGILLAMSAGVPVVASRVGGIPEIVRHRENGLLVDNDPQAVSVAVRELLADRILAARLAAEARKTVAERFSVEEMVRRTMEVYRKVLQ